MSLFGEHSVLSWLSVSLSLTGKPASNKFVNFHGQECARLDADVYIFGKDEWEGRPIFKIINILLFGALGEHALRLRRVWADRIIIQPRWKDYVTRMTNELSWYTVIVRVFHLPYMPFLMSISQR